MATVARCALASGILLTTLLLPARASAKDPDRVEWSPDWPRIRLWEVLDVIALTVASEEINSKWPTPTSAKWKSMLFDEWARNTFRARSAGTQLDASSVGDFLYRASVLTPYIVDNFFVAMSVHRNADVAIQMTLIDMQALGMAGVVTLASERMFPRVRPFSEDCGRDGNVRDAGGAISESCGHGDDAKSFYSGHAAAVATMAGLTCVHHQHLPLYGGGVADLAPCVFMIGVATFTGMTRLVADRHWASDVIVGWTVGALSGYVVPSLLHYGWGGGRPLGQLTVGGVSMVPVPETYPGGGGMGVSGVF